MVAHPLIRHLLDQPECYVTITSREPERAAALAGGHPHATTLFLSIDDTAQLSTLIAEHDIVVSLLPATLHVDAARMCITHKKSLVTTSYVSPAMRSLGQAAREAGVLLLNEMGLDPGIDHMSAMRVIHDVQQRGGQVLSFKSYCGGLPAPDSANNPWRYKFSWSPRGVCTAGKNAARFRRDGKQVDIPGAELFQCVERMHVEGVGELETYPNRDSLGYIDLYGLDGVESMLRGTLRYPGWCEVLQAVVALGLLDETPVTYPADLSYANWFRQVSGAAAGDDLHAYVAGRLGVAADAHAVHCLDWLGLFGDEVIPAAGEQSTALDVLAQRMTAKMSFAGGERDMIVMRHEFIARLPGGTTERTNSTLLEFGPAGDDSAMARTVSLPAAVAARLILAGKICETGVHIPVSAEIYTPVLDALAQMGIRFAEETQTA